MQKAKAGSQPYIFGPGGLVSNVDANKELLEKIQKTKPLRPSKLIELANFLRGYETNALLADDLELVALRQIVFESSVREAITEAGLKISETLSLNTAALIEAHRAVPKTHPFNMADYLEDSDIPFVGDGGADEKKESQPAHVKRVPFYGVGLLVKIVYHKAKDGKPKKSYYIIGVGSQS